MPISKTPIDIGRVLLTRPEPKNKELAQTLATLQFETVSCPMVEIAPIATPQLQVQINQLRTSDIIIAVSAHAVTYATKVINVWPQEFKYYAIGKATQRMMANAGIDAISPSQPISESLLTEPGLQQVSGRKVLILRGVGGRETLARQLSLRGAQVEYCQLYRREPIKYDPEYLIQSWKNHNVKTIVVTSGEILKNLLTLVSTIDQQWLVGLNIVVPSERVAILAQERGFSRCFVAAGASNKAISQTLMTIEQ